jgi:hypothetical protein
MEHPNEPVVTRYRRVGEPRRRESLVRGLSNGDRRRFERTLAEVEKDRSKPLAATEIAALISLYGSPDPAIRADALRRSCSCHVPWEVYYKLRDAALQLRNDPDARVRSIAEHLEDDAGMLRNFETRVDALAERDEKVSARHADKYRRPRRRL